MAASNSRGPSSRDTTPADPTRTGRSGGSVGRVRDAVSSSRTRGGDAEAMQNLAYVVSSANENIVALQRTIKLQEKELADKSEHSAALQRNYETLSRIRQSDQKEFIALKAQQAEEREQLEHLKELYAAEQAKTLALEQKLQTTAEAEAQLQHARLELQDASRERDEYRAAGEKHQRAAAEAVDANRTLKLSLDKPRLVLTRSQQELAGRAKRADDALKTVEGDKEAAEKANAATVAKLAVQDRQLKTFLEANEALEADLNKQAQLERRKQELEAEQQTIEAYYQARLDEMQTQYDKLLAKQQTAVATAREEVFRTFDDNREHVPGGSPRGKPE